MQKHLQTKRGSLLAGILLLLCTITTLAQGQSVKGKVTDAETGEPLPGVNVLVKGTSNGSTTDAEGVYSVSASSKDVLVFSFIGFTTQELTVGEQTTIDVKLSADAQALGEVVVVGYGTQKKEHLTGAIATTNIEQYAKMPTGNALAALQGQIAGVNISMGTGNPANAPTINIRGIGSINGAEPLFVIDGIPSDPNAGQRPAEFLNPSEIESISILKDASAATIYGSRGFGGVVLINTKKGKAGEPKLTLDTYAGIHNVNLNDIRPATRAQRNFIATESFTNAGLPVPVYADPGGQSAFANTNWADEYFKTGVEQKYDVGVSGGSDKMNYSLVLGYYKHNGTVINTGVERYNTRLNLGIKNLAKGRLNLNSVLSFNRKNAKNFYDDTYGGGGYSQIMNLFQALPHKKVYDKDGLYGYAGHVPALGLNGAGNLIAQQMLPRNKSEDNFVQLNLSADLKIINDLTYSFQVGSNVSDTYFDGYTPAYDYGPGAINEFTNVFQSRSRVSSFIINNLVKYSKSIQGHNFNVLLGQSAENNLIKSLIGSNNQMPSPSVEALSKGIGVRNSGGLIIPSRLHSYFSRLTYNYDERYFFEASFREDGSSKFGPENRFAKFWGVSAGWAMHREQFFSVEFINELKLRVSHGIVGNQNITPFQYQAVISSGGSTLNYPFGTAISPEALVGGSSISLSDANLGWEENAMTNAGLDLGIMQGKLSLSLDYFNSKASKMLVLDPLPPSSGIQEYSYRNVGTMQNSGYEVQIKYRNSIGEIKYGVGLNVSGVKNKVKDIRGNQVYSGYVEYSNYATTRTERGQPIGSFYLYDAIGIFQSQAEADAYVNGSGDKIQPNAEAGDLKFRDINGDGEITDDDKKYFGVGIPKVEIGLNLDASWKGFDVLAQLSGTFGNKMYNAFKHNTYRLGFNPELTDSWSETNKNSSIPRLINTDPNGNYKVASDYFLENGSYMRLRNLQIGYNFSSSVVSKFGISKMRIYIGGTNLITFTKYSGFDPGNTNYGIYARGVDRGYYPISKSFVGGLSLTF